MPIPIYLWWANTGYYRSNSNRHTVVFMICMQLFRFDFQAVSALYRICISSLSSEGFSTRRTCLTVWRLCKPMPSRACRAWWTWSVAGGSTSSPPCSLATSLLSGPLTTTTASSSANTERTCPSNSTDCWSPRGPRAGPGQETEFSHLLVKLPVGFETSTATLSVLHAKLLFLVSGWMN